MDVSKYQMNGKQLLADVQELVSVSMGQRIDGPLISALCVAIAEHFNRTLAPLIEMMSNPAVKVQSAWGESPVARIYRDAKMVKYSSPPIRIEPARLGDPPGYLTWSAALHGIGKPVKTVPFSKQFQIPKAEFERLQAEHDTYGYYDRLVDQPASPSVYATMGATGWCCKNPCCPPRAAISSSTAPTCYTCGEQMTTHQ